ncbi:MAG: hypothetical protein MI802_16675, partial [Desulfobacterales bacterium]|nr:hypothetical protein [Desulfobacterales bacterium]
MKSRRTIKKHPTARLIIAALIQWLCIGSFLCTSALCHPHLPEMVRPYDTVFAIPAQTALLSGATDSHEHS